MCLNTDRVICGIDTAFNSKNMQPLFENRVAPFTMISIHHKKRDGVIVTKIVQSDPVKRPKKDHRIPNPIPNS
jgi:hypothetical protein